MSLCYNAHMTQFFALGSSSVYGVGSANGGWADLIKYKLHQKMYQENGVGEKYELYNLSKPGATIEFIKELCISTIPMYTRNGQTIALLNVGGNDAKAEGTPTNYLSTPKEFKQKLVSLIPLLKKHFSYIFFVAYGYYDEAKVNPKISPFTGQKSYFSNKRKGLFQKVVRDVCQEYKLEFIQPQVDKTTWLQKYIYKDGLHPNSKGYKIIADKVWSELQSTIFK